MADLEDHLVDQLVADVEFLTTPPSRATLEEICIRLDVDPRNLEQALRRRRRLDLLERLATRGRSEHDRAARAEARVEVRLYKVIFRHYSEKNRADGVKTWVIADNDLQVMIGADNEFGYGGALEDVADEADGSGSHAAGYTLASWLRHRGEIDNPDFPATDFYYGSEKIGWEIGTEIDVADAEALLRLGVAVDWRGIDITPARGCGEVGDGRGAQSVGSPGGRSPMITRIISGGQTGADRAGLDFAIGAGIPHGGFCPHGRTAEDGRIPDIYQLEEMAPTGSRAEAYRQRTRANVQAADGTAIFTIGGALEGGSLLTWRTCYELEKPRIQIWTEVAGGEWDVPTAVGCLRSWLERHDIKVLNVAGQRASKAPRVYVWTRTVLRGAIGGASLTDGTLELCRNGRRLATTPTLAVSR
jgi:Circularly permutated YpsA SLOG family